MRGDKGEPIEGRREDTLRGERGGRGHIEEEDKEERRRGIWGEEQRGALRVCGV